MKPGSLLLTLLILAGGVSLNGHAAAKKAAPKPAAPSPYADWVEPAFPFYSSILDARKAGGGFPTNNLTPRGLVLPLGHDCQACFDVDLLRVSAIWRGKGVTPDALAQKSYHLSGGKTPGGQFPAPRPVGDVWLANGIYPGWQTGFQARLADPREPAPSPEEIGRGPLPETFGHFQALRLAGTNVVLEYLVAGTAIREWLTASLREGRPVVERHFEIGPAMKPLLLMLGAKQDRIALALGGPSSGTTPTLVEEQGRWTVRLPARNAITRFCVTAGETAIPMSPKSVPDAAAPSRWPHEVVTRGQLSGSKAAYVVDDIALPVNNPWRRNVRPGDIQFLADGTGVLVTLDGDVWLARGLRDSLAEIRWRRFASGLHEPMTAAIRDDQIHVFDRNGIWRLRDTDGNGEADVHELFSNAFAQTADMREFPSTIRPAPDGGFVIAKGGQQATTLGKHNGSVLRVSADGRSSTVLGYGFRQPAIGVHPRTGLVTSSDQEGQYIPSTPLHLVRDGQFYGYLAEGLQEREKYPAPIAAPLTWMPHAVNASAISQIWLFGARLGALNESLVHIGFNKPELFRILLNPREAQPQAAVVSITGDFQFPPLNGAVNPADGQLYIAGFQVQGWGNALNRLAGLGRVRYTGAPVTLPREIVPMDQGVLLRFDVALDPRSAANPDNYSLASWHYVRTYKYGSAQYRADGEPGIDWLTASSAYLSRDGRAVFIGVPGMKPVMQLRLGWSLRTTGGLKFGENAHTTPYALTKFDPAAEGFGDLTVDLTPRTAARRDEGPVTVEEGRRLAQLLGCAACHSVNGMDVAKVGPTWTGLFGSERPVVINRRKTTARADAAYLRESLLDPTAKIVAGFEKGEYAMPSYAGVVNDSQVQALILYIQAVKDGDAAAKLAPPAGTFE